MMKKKQESDIQVDNQSALSTDKPQDKSTSQQQPKSSDNHQVKSSDKPLNEKQDLAEDENEKKESLIDKLKDINQTKNLLIEYLKKDESKIAIREIKNILFGAIRHILPRRFKAEVWFGFEDPATTGNVLGILSIFYGIYGEKLNLYPNFEKEELKLRYELKGRIRVFTLLVAAFKLYKNKWIRDFKDFWDKNIKCLKED